MGEHPACEAYPTLLEEQARHQHARWLGAERSWKTKTSSLTRQALLPRSSFEPTSVCPTYLFFLELLLLLYYSDSLSIESHSLTSNLSRKNTKTVYSIQRTIRRVAIIHNQVGKITGWVTGFFNPSFGLHNNKKWPYSALKVLQTPLISFKIRVGVVEKKSRMEQISSHTWTVGLKVKG